MRMRDAALTGVTMLGLAGHTLHEMSLPPCRRKEHAEEKEPMQATDLGMTIIYSASTKSESVVPFIPTQISQPMPAPRRAQQEAYWFGPVGPPPEHKTPLSWLS